MQIRAENPGDLIKGGRSCGLMGLLQTMGDPFRLNAPRKGGRAVVEFDKTVDPALLGSIRNGELPR